MYFLVEYTSGVHLVCQSHNRLTWVLGAPERGGALNVTSSSNIINDSLLIYFSEISLLQSIKNYIAQHGY